MAYGCNNCTYTNDCSDKKGQCTSYTFATAEQIEKTGKELNKIKASTVNIHDYDAQDAITRQLLADFEKKI